jgi:putative ABC transport system substrate-binding protein
MRRRDFIAGLGSAAAWPVVARAQQERKLPTIGFLGANTASAQSRWTAAFVQRLRELGWIEGRTIAIEYRWAEGRTDRAPEIVAEFVRLKLDVLVTGPCHAGAKAELRLLLSIPNILDGRPFCARPSLLGTRSLPCQVVPLDTTSS